MLRVWRGQLEVGTTGGFLEGVPVDGSCRRDRDRASVAVATLDRSDNICVMSVKPRSGWRESPSASQKSTTARLKSAGGAGKASGKSDQSASTKLDAAAGTSRQVTASAAKSAVASARSTIGGHSAEAVGELLVDATRKLHEVEQVLEELRIEVAGQQTATDALGGVAEIFVDELRSLLGDAPPDAGAIRRAARLTVAEEAWAQRLGELWETKDVVALLGVSRQRVSALAKTHRLIVVPGGGRTRFPAWQFAGTSSEDRDCLGKAQQLLVDVGHIDPWSAASWFLTGHPDLDGRDPVDWVRTGGAQDRLLAAAGRDAARAAQ